MKKRELASWVGLAALGVFLIAVCGVVGWAIMPRERRLLLGAQAEFAVDKPQARALDPGIHLFVVNLRGQVIAWDAKAPVTKGTRCNYKWVPTNNRFEDPCSGSKWCLDGTVADDRYGPVRTLDQYRIKVDGSGNVWLYPGQKIQGQLVPTAVSPELDTIRHACDSVTP